MAVAFGTAATPVSSSSAATLSPGLPTFSAGDLLFGICCSKNNGTHSWPAGWTKVNQTNSGTLWTVSFAWRIAQVGDTAPTISWTGAVACAAGIWSYTGEDSSSPIGAVSAGSTGTTSPHTSASITTTRANSLCIYLDGCSILTALTTPSGYVSDYNNGFSGPAIRLNAGSKTVAASGSATGAISTAGGAAAWVQWQIEIKAPPAAPQQNYTSGPTELSPAAFTRLTRLANYNYEWKRPLGQVPYLMMGPNEFALTPAPPPIQQSVTWRQVGMLGRDQMIAGDQIFDLPVRVAYRLEQSAYLNLLETTLLTIAAPVGDQIFDLPVRGPPPIQQSWTWRQVGVLGQDILFVGAEITDLPPRAPQRLPIYTWVWNQIPMLGQDKLPIGEQVFDLTGRPYRIDQFWSWRQVDKLGQDVVPGEQVTDLTAHRYIVKPIEQTWVWRQVDKLGKDILPENQYSWPLPQLNPYFTNYRQWTWRHLHMLGMDVLPENQFDWPLPGRPPRLDQTWSLNLNLTTLAPTGQAPFNQYDWPTTPAAKRIDYTWSWSYNLNLIGKDVLPFNQYSWPLPGQPWRLEQTWTLNLQETTLTPSGAKPFAQTEWPLTPAAKRIDETWSWRQVDKIGLDVLPENQYDWPLPGRPYRIEQTTTWNQVSMLGQDRLPVGDQVYDLWVRPAKPIEQTWTWRQTIMLGKDVLPKNQYDWPLPRVSPYWSSYRSWDWRQVLMLGQDRLPTGEQVYDRPGLTPQRAQDWIQSVNLNLTAAPAFPKNNYDWPIFRAPQQLAPSWTWRQVGMLGKDQLPVGEQVYDRPIPAPQRAQELYTWIQLVNLSLVTVAGTPPPNQYDWPLPKTPQQPALGTAFGNAIQLDIIGRVPKNQFDWPLPNRGPAQFTRSWEWRQTGMFGQDRLPQNQYDWPNPKTAAQFNRGYTWRHNHMFGQDRLPKNQYDWPLPQRVATRPTPTEQLQNLLAKLAPPKPPPTNYDWPVPPRPLITDHGGWVWSWIYYTVQIPSFMPGTTDWPLPDRPFQFDRSFTQNNSILTPPGIVTNPATGMDWPLPDYRDRPPFQPDRSFTYTSAFAPPIPPPVLGGTYFLLQPHYINDTYYQAWTTVTEGREVPFGWIPTLMVDPLNDRAVQMFYAAGPRQGYPGPGYDWQAWQYTDVHRQAAIQSPVTHWVESSPGMFSLTGLGAGLPPIGV